MRLADDLRRLKWRSMKKEEHEELQAALAFRKQISKVSPDELDLLEIPQAARTSAEGVSLWAISTLWQDRPALVAIGVLALGMHILYGLWRILHHFL